MDTTPSPKALLFGLALSFVAYLLLAILYRLFFHPLSRYPGPFWAKLSDWYNVYHTGKGDHHCNFYRLHLKYGPIVRHGPHRLSFNTPGAVRDIYGGYGSKVNIIKDPYYTVTEKKVEKLNVVAVVDPVQHSRKRRNMAPAFTTSAVKAMEAGIIKNLNLYCDAIGATEETAKAASTDLAQLTAYFAFDAMTSNVFSRGFNILSSAANRWIPKTLANAVTFTHVLGYMPALALLEHLPSKPQMVKDVDRILELNESLASERAQRKSDADNPTKDVFSYLLGAKDPETGGPGLDHAELFGESIVLMVAGSDTTALSITATFYQLARHPACHAKLRAEISAAFSKVEDIQWGTTLSGCTYLRACIDEAMRLTPAVGGVLPRVVLAPGAIIAGETLPAGTSIGVPAYALHRLPENFPDPLAFRPERWIASKEEGVSEMDVRKAKEAFFPFSIGPRACLGKHLAYVEMTLAVARVLWLYDMERVDSRQSKDWLEAMKAEGGLPTVDKFVSHPTKGMMFHFRRRKECSV